MNLVQKLRLYTGYSGDNTTTEAADEIERLQKECRRLADEVEDWRDRACFGEAY